MRIEWGKPWWNSIVWWRSPNGENGYPITDYIWMFALLGLALGAWAFMVVLA